MGDSFKKGSGSLNFGEEEPDDESESVEPSNEESREIEETSPQSSSAGTPVESSSTTYPYFVRRSSVTDERDNRLEIHIRDEVADREREYRNALADELGTGSVPKTDAREFALKLAYEHPEKVAELMEEEGYGELDG